MIKLFYLISGIFVFQVSLISFFTGWQLAVSIPIGISIGFITYKNPDSGLKLLLFLLPVSGLISNLISSNPIISFLFVPLAAWIVGYHQNISRNKLSFFMHPLVSLFIFFLVWIIISEVHAIYYYIPDMPHWTKIISKTYKYGIIIGNEYGYFPVKGVRLINALGWIVMGAVNWSGGIIFSIYLFDYFNRYPNRVKLMSWVEKSLWVSLGVGLYQAFIDNTFAYLGDYNLYKRINASFSDPNVMACFLMMIIPFIIAISFLKNNYKIIKRKIILLCGLSFLILQSGARVPFIGLAGILFFMFLKKIKINMRFIKNNLKMLLPISIGLLIVIYLSKNASILRFRNTFNLIQGSGHTVFKVFSERMPYWKAGILTFQENYLLGVGVGRYLIALPEILINNKLILHTPNENACNMYIQAGAEMGFIGLLIFLYIMIKHICPAYKAVKNKNLLVSVTGLICLIMLVLIGISNYLMNIEVSLLFWLISSNIWVSYDKILKINNEKVLVSGNA